MAWGPLRYYPPCAIKTLPQSCGVGVSKLRCLAISWSLLHRSDVFRLVLSGDRSIQSEPEAAASVSLLAGGRLDDLDDASFRFCWQRRPRANHRGEVGVGGGVLVRIRRKCAGFCSHSNLANLVSHCYDCVLCVRFESCRG